MSKIITWTFTNYWSYWLINDEFLVPEGNFLGIESWANVNAEVIEWKPNCYKVVWLVSETKDKVEKIVEGYFKETSKWFWFIKVLGQKKEIFVPQNSISWAKNWDKVRAVLGISRWKREALITEILDKVNPIFIWEVIVKNDSLFLELENSDVYPIKNIKWIKKWDILSVFLEKNETSNESNIVLKEVLWDKNDLWIQTVIIAARNWARIHFPKEVLDEANSLDWSIDDAEIKNRVDLRDLFTVTIDWPTAKDKDDAISVKTLENGEYILYVSIADVTHYVKEDFAIDSEALLRGTSLYYWDKVTPMIPEILSNDICSLNPNVEKLTVTCEVFVNSDWTPNIEKSKVYNSIIKSNHAVTYEEVDSINNWIMELWDDLMFWNKVSEELKKLVKDSFKLSDTIWKVFKKNWKLWIDSTESKIILDKDKKPIGVEAYPKHKSNELIENCMVIANNVVPQIMEIKLLNIEWLENKMLPFVHRTHGTPNDDAVEKLKNVLEVLEVDYEFPNNSPKSFSMLLDFIKWHPKEKFLTKKITTTLDKAIYTAIREWHFWLALEYYSHFTSPIRRYPDLQIHRIIKEILDWTLTVERYEHYIAILNDVTEQSTRQEEMSERNESDVNKYLWLELMKNEIWNSFWAYIDNITGKKIKIILDNTVSWIIDLSQNKWYDSEKLYEGIFKIKNSKTKEEIWLWDEVSVILEKADTENMELYFKLEK